MHPLTAPGWALQFVGLGLAIDCGKEIYRGYKSETWEKAEGRIVSTSIDYAGHTYGRGAVAFYTPAITYRYEVNGIERQGTRLKFGGHWPFPGAAERLRNQYREGQRVVVFYNPEDPDKAVLESGVSSDNVFAFWVGIGLFVIGWLMRISGPSASA